MSGSTIGGSGQAPLIGGLVDVIEGFNGGRVAGNNPNAFQLEFRSLTQVMLNPNPHLFDSQLGTNGLLGFDATTGQIVQTWPSAAGASAHSGQVGTSWGVPVWQRFQAVNAIPRQFQRALRSYRIDYLARMTIQGASEVVCGWGTDTAPIIVGGGNNPAVVWSSRVGIAGGSWTPRYRLVTAGVITDGPSSAPLASDWSLLSIRYTEGLIPRIEWLINDTVLFSLAGDANMPTSIGAFPQMFAAKAVSGPAGTTVQFNATRFRISEIP